MASARPGHIERLPSGSYRVIVYTGTDPLTRRGLRFPPNGEDGRAGTDLPRQAAGAGRRGAAARHRSDGRGATPADVTVAELDCSTRQTLRGLHQADRLARPRADQAAQGPPPSPQALARMGRWQLTGSARRAVRQAFTVARTLLQRPGLGGPR